MTFSGDSLLDLRHRMRSAHARLEAMAEASGSRSNARRLRYKAQGVGLALSYVEESLREAAPTSEGRSSLAAKHQEHYRSCGCLGDSAVCCDPTCECRTEAAESEGRES